MELNDKVTQLEDEIKILKNEVQAVLLDLRESYLNNENPFNPNMQPMASQPIIINQPAPDPAPPEPSAVPEPVPDSVPEPVPEEIAIPEPVVSVPQTAPVAPVVEMVEEKEEPPEELPDSPAEDRKEPPEAVEIVSKPEVGTSEETAPEEATKGWRPRIGSTAPFTTGGINNSPGGIIDLENMAGLAQWVEEAVIKLGPERTEAALDISEMMGHLSPELKNILVKFISPAPEQQNIKVATRDYLASLIELTGLLGKASKSEIALLYILCQENDNR